MEAQGSNHQDKARAWRCTHSGICGIGLTDVSSGCLCAMPACMQWREGGAMLVGGWIRGRTVRCARAVRQVGCVPPSVATGPRVLNSAPYTPLLVHQGFLFFSMHMCLVCLPILFPSFASLRRGTPPSRKKVKWAAGASNHSVGTPSYRAASAIWQLVSDACHASQGPEFCTQCCFELIMHPSVGGWFSGVFPG